MTISDSILALQKLRDEIGDVECSISISMKASDILTIKQGER